MATKEAAPTRRRLFERAQPAPYNVERTITASAQRINLRDRTQVTEIVAQTGTSKWQEDAWNNFDEVGEVGFAFGLVASVMSRLRILPAVVMDPAAPPVPLTDAVTIERPAGEEDSYKTNNGITAQQAVEARDIWNNQFSKSSIPNMLRAYSLNLSVPGECYLALIDSRWMVKSTSELRVDQSGKPKLTRTRSGTPKELEQDTPIGRIWRGHPRFSFEATSSMRAVNKDCEELLLLGQLIRVNARARMNAGILFVPDEIVVASQSTDESEDEVDDDEESVFEKELFEALSAPAITESHANSLIPLLLRGPAELGDKIKYIELSRKVDQYLVERSERTLERILQGIDVPKDIVTGLANVKYSNAIQIDENLYKAHVEPGAVIFCDAVTDIIFQPLLRAAGWDNETAARLVAWYDPTEVTTRPDQAADAMNLYNANELSGSALRSAHGFSESDKPSEEELAAKAALSQIMPPEIVATLLQSVFPKLLHRAAAAAGAPDELPPELQQALGGEEDDPTAVPDLPPTVPAGPPPGLAPAAEDPNAPLEDPNAAPPPADDQTVE